MKKSNPKPQAMVMLPLELVDMEAYQIIETPISFPEDIEDNLEFVLSQFKDELLYAFNLIKKVDIKSFESEIERLNHKVILKNFELLTEKSAELCDGFGFNQVIDSYLISYNELQKGIILKAFSDLKKDELYDMMFEFCRNSNYHEFYYYNDHYGYLRKEEFENFVDSFSNNVLLKIKISNKDTPINLNFDEEMFIAAVVKISNLSDKDKNSIFETIKGNFKSFINQL